MNDHLNPVFQTATRGFCPPAPNNTLRAALSSFDAPPPPAGQFAYVYQHPELRALDCHLEHEPAAPECGWPEEVTLQTAYLRGVDITDRLTRDEVQAIEHAALHAPKKFQEPA